MKDKWNGWARWIIVAMAVMAAIYGNFRNAAVLENDVEHLQAATEQAMERNEKDHAELKEQIKELRLAIMKGHIP